MVFFFPLSLFFSSLKTVGCVLGQNRLQRDIISSSIMPTKQLYFLSLGATLWFPWRRLGLPHGRTPAFPLPSLPSWIPPTSYWDGGSFPRIRKRQQQSQAFCSVPYTEYLTPNSPTGGVQYLVDKKAIEEATTCFWVPISSNDLVVSNEDGDLEVPLPLTGLQGLVYNSLLSFLRQLCPQETFLLASSPCHHRQGPL